MTSIEEHLDNYFSTLNPITRKIWNDLENVKKAYGEEEWNQLNSIQQEEILVKYMISDDIREKYEHIEKENTPEVFPRLRIQGGEKIVVDFENEDGWTWKDEHSGPFSWMNKSQQDLTLDDLDNLGEQIKKTKRGVSRSPERDLAGKHRWETSQGTNANAEAAHTAGEIFQKFGITFSFRKDGEDSISETKSDQPEEAELLVEQEEYDNLTSCDSQSGYDTLLRDDNLSESYDLSSYRTSTMSTTSSTSSTNKKKTKSQGSRSEAELSLMGDTLSYREQVSPVYLEDPGESSTDHGSSFTSNYDIEVQAESPSVLGMDPILPEQSDDCTSVILSHPATPHSDWQTSTFTDADDSAKEEFIDVQSSTSPTKTGFDFLDNW